MRRSQLSVITHAIIVSRILYARPAWGGFLSSQLAAKIDALFKRLERFGYLDRLIIITDLVSNSDNRLLNMSAYPTTVCITYSLQLAVLIAYTTVAIQISCQITSASYIEIFI